ncbi:uncharacterized protein LOC141700219 [Apium graveolens]|uniref:uncharacterized protein LOC141700219 n=1 Tax=Apium graveolens TaxID=4045 RepID=UPI003D79BE6E
MARSFLKEKKLPLTFWGEAIRHSIYVLNRLPTRSVSGMTPHEAWSGIKPNIGHIRIFGCLAYMKLPSVHTTKLSDRSKLVINLGKEPGSKAYRLYDPKQNVIHVSRDVVFEESKAWPWESNKEIDGETRETFTIFGSITESDRSTNIEEDHSVSPMSERSNTTSSESVRTLSSFGTGSTSSDVDTDSAPKHYRSLNEIYDETQEIELEDEELMLTGMDEPRSFTKTASEHHWREAMECEITAVERNNTWKLTELPPG